uniref:Adaptor protein, phosphotyrosine interaction, PH domain and leucine zipper containing 1 n=1 Tax=Callorhinchus milii TaxID=7868 RepID=A0A4W3H321_CALMI
PPALHPLPPRHPARTRSLLGVFEEDAAAISNYTNQLYKAMKRIYDAQNELSAATHLTSKLLKEYEKQCFPLGGDDEVMTSTLQQFSQVIDELSSCHAVLSTQLADAMMFPIRQFKEKDIKEMLTLKEVFAIASNGDIVYGFLSSEQIKLEASEDLYTSRKKQHQTMMHYFCALNTLQYKKKMTLLEPLLGYMQAQISFFKMGTENMTAQLEEFLSNIGTSVQGVRREMESEVDSMQQTIEDLEIASDALYLPDSGPQTVSVNRNLTRKTGYLNTRNKTSLVSSTWERHYYFTQGGNLMRQARGEVAGGLVMDLDNNTVMAVDCEDRRYCFQITWITTINNISRRIYLSENPEVSLHVAVYIEQFMFIVLKVVCSCEVHFNLSRHRTSRSNSSNSLGSESAVLSSVSLDSIVAPDTPIQFDIISPVSEDLSNQSKNSGQGARRTNPFGESGETKAEEPEESILHQLFIVRFLGSMEVKTDENSDVIYETMRQILAARAIHNIFRMTESHLLVTCDCLKLIDPQTQVTRLRFPLQNVVLCATHTENKRLFGFVLRTAGSRTEGRAVSVCYVFESNNEGEKVKKSTSLLTYCLFHQDRRATEKQKEIDREKERQLKELDKQKQIEKDLEKQSRLIAASNRPNPGEGQVLVLSSSQSEDSDAGDDGKKKRESEA